MVAATDQAPPLEDTSALDGFPRCGQYNDAPPVGADAVITCEEGIQGRYVYIYIAYDYLTLCEVQVLSDGKLLECLFC